MDALVQRVEVYQFPTELGQITIAATERGAVQVLLPGTPLSQLMERCLDRFANTQIARVAAATSWLEPAIAAVMARLNALEATLPALDVQATEFEHQVWQAVSQIPRGQTRSYQQIAKAIMRPNATRAVGQACGANPVPLLVPCHRVVGSKGRLVGFGAGLDLKAKLLAHEGALLM